MNHLDTNSPDLPVVVWLKRDLRLTDHTSLLAASEKKKPIMLLYIFEPSLIADPHYDERHWRFVWQSLADLNRQLSQYHTQIHIVLDEAINALETLFRKTPFSHLFSYEETGIRKTYLRDKIISNWVQKKKITWIESPTAAVIRGLVSRVDWDKHWDKIMRRPIVKIELKKIFWFAFEPTPITVPESWQSTKKGMQTGGPTLAIKTLESFFEERGKAYYYSISSPSLSRSACSRLSPYLAWGNISLREVYQYLLEHWNKPKWRRTFIAFSSRLHWHCHFIQKFESECDMELRAVNQAYHHYPYRKDDKVESDLICWMQGTTGYPLVDACMRALHHTGYINFRMRAMLVSFLCHHLNIDWRLGVHHLARLFLDFEPGIHYPQFQMQAGITGTNTIRIYNPILQSQEHDSDALFIKRWVPELNCIPNEIVHKPWELTPMEEAMYEIEIGREYPSPIIDFRPASKAARDRLWGFQKRTDVKSEKYRILKTHIRPTKKVTKSKK